MMRDAEPAGRTRVSDMTERIIDSVSVRPVGFVFDLGPRGYSPAEEEEGLEAICSQVVVLQDDVLVLRRSRTVLHRLNFEDCTDGYIFTADAERVIGIVAAWFRDRAPIKPLETRGRGCDLSSKFVEWGGLRRPHLGDSR